MFCIKDLAVFALDASLDSELLPPFLSSSCCEQLSRLPVLLNGLLIEALPSALSGPWSSEDADLVLHSSIGELWKSRVTVVLKGLLVFRNLEPCGVVENKRTTGSLE